MPKHNALISNEISKQVPFSSDAKPNRKTMDRPWVNVTMDRTDIRTGLEVTSDADQEEDLDIKDRNQSKAEQLKQALLVAFTGNNKCFCK